MDNLNIKIEYIYNSGFTVETKNHFLIFDYYKGKITFSNKPTTIFVSHEHEDHYNTDIFDFKGNIDYVVSDDIKTDENVNFVTAGSNIVIGDLDIEVFGSTDLGVSFLVSVDNINIFHAGDLNWWYWEDDTLKEKEDMKEDFKEIINKIKGLKIDIGFFPVDPRLGQAYQMGGEYFIKKLSPTHFIPMHFGDNYDITSKFIHRMKDFNTHIVEIKNINQEILL